MNVDQKDQGSPLLTVFAKMHESMNAAVLADTEKISAQSEAIRQLEEITRQVETPYIGSYLTA